MRSRFEVDPTLQAFVDQEVLSGTGLDSRVFWDGVESSFRQLAPRNRELLERREDFQRLIDDWFRRGARGYSTSEFMPFLREIGYLVPGVEPFSITTTDVDPEISELCGPQLVVPVTNARYALNAVNARWGSLYDALYGTDALGDAAPPGPYSPSRGERVVAWTTSFLDDVLPLEHGSHNSAVAYTVAAGRLSVALDNRTITTTLRDVSAFAGYAGDPEDPSAILLTHHGLGIELRLDRTDSVGAAHKAGICDVLLEAAVSTIIDFEDSVACVDATEKVDAYRNWLGLMKGDLTETFAKGDTAVERRIAGDRSLRNPDGQALDVRGRSLMMARVVGHLTTTDAITIDGDPAPEGILDTFIVTAIALHDLKRPPEFRNSRTGSIYIVKPKMHGPEEVRFTCNVFREVERVLDVPTGTIKLGIMDEEVRTSVNLAACIREAADRVVFVNTGFLDRTGDEIHTTMRAGPVVRKDQMRATTWLRAYEDWNVDTALRCGFRGRAQVGKGMWAAPDRMGAMLAEKIAHPQAGATCAWVPSPTAATLHATHYHRVDVRARQEELEGLDRASVEEMLALPLADITEWSERDISEELDNNLQGILGYVVRWVDQGIGCSKVPDIANVALMEDRATCRISSQHVANWLHHGVISAEQVDAALARMAAVVDEQNSGDPAYRPMAPTLDGPAFLAAKDLVYEGTHAPSGYTEPTLHSWRRVAKGSPMGRA